MVPIAGKWVLICALAIFQGTLWQNPGIFFKGSADVMACEMVSLQEDQLCTLMTKSEARLYRALILGLCRVQDQVGTLWSSWYRKQIPKSLQGVAFFTKGSVGH